MIQIETQFLNEQSDIKLAWVFGSYAQNKQKPESDLDIAVAGQGPLSLEMRVELTNEISRRVSKEVDLVDLQAERGIISSQVLTRGILIVKRDTLLLALMIQRLWYDRADFWPLREQIYAARRKKAFE